MAFGLQYFNENLNHKYTKPNNAMLSNKPIEQIRFISIKTVSQHASYESLPGPLKLLFYERYENAIIDEMRYVKEPAAFKADATEIIYQEKAPLSTEFGKIVCFGIGAIKDGKLQTKIICLDDEQELLRQVAVLNFLSAKDLKELKVDLCGHAIKSFHFPFLHKRMIMNGLTPPILLDTSEIKPWDLTFLADTLEAWKMGMWDGSASLDLLAETFRINRGDQVRTGKKINDLYWKDKDLVTIEKYCADSVFVLAQVYAKMKCLNITLTR